ncbi:uncharacterized protein M421DRAFT_10050 [Didymella exigua CBS 183.55]|uniref:Uncharacterized protein n=1 Tax=Didymella exigua CBS 183.55 TaxID=1150837 RepID=A0A6A5RB64_9PLEO|nr:uncharacterized protein M421DRAFT_10050 [Didymella exigua CBS 183.55]KAF1923037.1 hypothetical protein M421DRAFT_10050 [Didymella exigua CBS 183.55]
MLKSKWAPQTGDEAPQAATTESKPAPAQQPAAAPAVDAAYGAYNDASLGSFAQTAGTDDLFFDDDITPISQPVVEPSSTLAARAPVFVPAPEQPAPPAAPQAHVAPKAPREPRNADRGGRGRGRGRGEGRGRGKGGRGRGGPVGDIRLEEAAAAAQESPAAISAHSAHSAHSAPEPASTGAEADAPAADAPPADAPTGPAAPTAASVRGDRTLTGGSKRTRLTEAELSAKLASMRSKNEALASAHARAEADAAAAEAREHVLKQQEVVRKKAVAEKQKAERKDRQQMMGEREKNRQRKLKAQGGREWDLDKEDGFDGTGEERRRGTARAAPEEGRELFDETGDAGAHRGRGRGRGGRSGGRGARGDARDSRGEARGGKQTSQRPPTSTDFPSLPAAPKTVPANADAPNIKDFSIKGFSVKDRGESKSDAKDDTRNNAKNEDMRKSEPALRNELEPQPKAETDDAPVRPAVKTAESFGLEPMQKGASWADDE